MNQDIWTNRQVMLGKFPFEFYHYLDEVPPQMEFHQHPFYELFFFLNGDVDYTIEGRTYKLRPGDILLTNSSDLHRPEARPGKPYERIVLWLDDSFFDQLRTGGDDLVSCFVDSARKDYRRVRPGPASLIHIRNLWEQIFAAQSSKLLGSYALTCAYLFELLVEVCRCYFDVWDIIDQEVVEKPKINNIIRYLNANIQAELSLDDVADHFYTSKYYLTRQFKKFTGMTIYQYIMKKRLALSRDMLRKGVPVTHACIECGFGDYSNFLKAFKREFGCNPRELVRRNTEEQFKVTHQ